MTGLFVCLCGSELERERDRERENGVEAYSVSGFIFTVKRILRYLMSVQPHVIVNYPSYHQFDVSHC